MDVARDYLQRIKGQLEDKGLMVKSQVIFGKATDELVDYVKNNNVGLVIIASHGRSGVSRWVWGSVADRILRGVCAPVMIIRAPGCYPGI
jgi:nucleotide-binding universal stress UspA family protein